jgi:tRNA A37 threonylcarbamoyladenosine biosynthesis protein TsaE
MDELGLDEALEDGAALIEWPERAEDRLPPDALTIHLSADAERRAILEGPPRWRNLESTYV